MDCKNKHVVIDNLAITIVEITGCIGNDRDHEYEVFQKYSSELFENNNYFIIFDIQLVHVNDKFIGLMYRMYEKCKRKAVI
ncbi:hypothetical protein [Candidatus Uabimicrobium sp. HlEnr_7]|uniref:hypothetical protein n=1 Tax=Candidatus Uabimicrobium helgolandensis TaxID=3095367 RepID=UPI003556B3CC